MKSLWNDAEAARFEGELGLRVYTSRLLGSDPSLVMHGGGNTSVKLRTAGAPETLYVKGTGSDLAQVAASDFTPLDLARTRELLEHPPPDNAEMMRLLGERVARADAPRPSIETMLHAALPYRYVEHTHADAILAVANVEDGERVVAEVYGELAPLVPYHHSGVALARACRDVFESAATPRTIGLILRFHGAIAFGESARASYENMLRLVTIAEDFLKRRGAWEVPADAAVERIHRAGLAALRARISRCAGFPLVMRCERDPACLAYARRPDLSEIALQGPPTPQHAVFTRRVPQLGRDVDRYAAGYRAYLAAAPVAAAAGQLDAAPRIVLDPEFGLCALGVDAAGAALATEMYRHDITIISRASAHGRYRSAPAAAIALAEVEYGGHEARQRADRSRPLLGTVALIAPGAARADPGLAGRLLRQGAAVAVAGDPSTANALPVAAHDVEMALDEACIAFGGIDTLYGSESDTKWASAAEALLDHSLAGERLVHVTGLAPSAA